MSNLSPEKSLGAARFFHHAFSLGALRPHRKRILPYLNRAGGSFIEIGARDGGRESLTLYLERALGWNGLLIEPWPHLFHKCRKKRRRSITLNVAATGRCLEDSYIEVIGRPPQVSIRQELVKNARERTSKRPAPVGPPRKRGRRVSYINTDSIDHILRRTDFPRDFDLLALNLRGYEASALEGLDFRSCKPTFLLARVNSRSLIIPNLPVEYQQLALSHSGDGTSLLLYRFAAYSMN